MKKMTMTEIKYRTKEKQPFFFSRATMKFFGQTLRDFKIERQPDGRYKIDAPHRKPAGSKLYTVRYFNPKTNDLEHK